MRDKTFHDVTHATFYNKKVCLIFMLMLHLSIRKQPLVLLFCYAASGKIDLIDPLLKDEIAYSTHHLWIKWKIGAIYEKPTFRFTEMFIWFIRFFWRIFWIPLLCLTSKVSFPLHTMSALARFQWIRMILFSAKLLQGINMHEFLSSILVMVVLLFSFTIIYR